MGMMTILGGDQRPGRAAAPAGAGSGARQDLDSQAGDRLVAQCLADAVRGEPGACFELGVVYSTGRHAAACDMIEAHKWFNLAAVAGHECAKSCRADIAGEMTMAQIAEAQRRARAWIAANNSRSPSA